MLMKLKEERNFFLILLYQITLISIKSLPYFVTSTPFQKAILPSIPFANGDAFG
jgi:hypothetical protein